MCPHRIGEQVDFATTDDPNSLWPQTTWDAVQGSFALASSSGHALGSSGGAETHTLTVQEMPSHSHPSAVAGWSGNPPATTSGTYAYPTTVGYYVQNETDRRETGNTGGGSPFSLLPPYVTVNRWKRVA